VPSGNGDHVTRAELNAHLGGLRREIGHAREEVRGLRTDMKEELGEVRDEVRAMHESLGAAPRWMGARFNAIVDKLMPAVIAAAALWVLSGGKLP
jgi:hypothetical protein